MAAPTEKDVETMPTQKIFKRRVRARMTKTGESYTAARRQLLIKATDPVEPGPDEFTADVAAESTPSTDAFGVSDDARERATGKGHAEWFALLAAGARPTTDTRRSPGG